MKQTIVVLENFKKDIVNYDVSFITSKWIIDRLPFIFSDNESYIFWKETLSKKIGVDSKSIIITGSASIGFSLNPEKNLRTFNEYSDVDIAIISGHYFDISWHYLRNIGPRMHALNPREKNAIEDHRKRLIYWGTIATDKIIQILPFGERWVRALSEMSSLEPTMGRDINIRIYKDSEALRAYHTNNLNSIKDNIIISG